MAPREVRILPALWSPKVWPLIVLLVGTVAVVVGSYLWEVTARSGGSVWFWIALMAVCVAWRFRTPVVILRPDGIGVTLRNAADDSDMGVAWNRNVEEADIWEFVPAEEIDDWRREDFGIVLRLRQGPPPSVARSVRFSLRGIQDRDRKQIVDWLTKHVGG